MAGLNKWLGIGYAGKDPDIHVFQDGSKIATFNIAVSQTYKNKKSGEKVTNTEWIKLVFFRNLADVVDKYVKKGSQIYVEGRLRNRDYEGKDGVKRFITEVVVDQMQMFGRPGEKSDHGLVEHEKKAIENKFDQTKNESIDNLQADIYSDNDPVDDLPF